MKQFWNKFYQRPLEKIPWQNTQADWFKELIDNKTITGKTALDLGCGTGKKSIYLAQSGRFQNVVGVDISTQAIEYAKTNARKAKVVDRCSFICHDLSKWTFLTKNQIFDFILDWAAIHCIPQSQLKCYSQNITKHCRSGGLLLVRSFFSPSGEKYFYEESDGIKSKIYLYKRKDLQNLFSEFHILSSNISKPKTKPQYQFIELLFQKK